MKRIRLIRVFNFVQPQAAMALVFFPCSWMFLQFLYSKSIQVSTTILVAIIVLIFYPLKYPKQLKLSQGTIVYREDVNFHNPRGKGWNSTKVEFTVSNIFKYELHQNWFERLFNVGHITFVGTTTFTAKKHLDRVPERRMHCLYGIPKFREFSQEVEACFQKG